MNRPTNKSIDRQVNKSQKDARKRIDQRVGVFVDIQNMYYSAKNLYGKKVNFEQVIRIAEAERSLIRAIAYVIKTDIKEEEHFRTALRNIGFEVKAKDLQIFPGGAKKGDWDVGIAIDMIELAPKLDVAVLVSGDGDFIPLVEHLKKAMGCRVEVIAFGSSTSGKLKEVADDFIDLEPFKNKVLRK
ncbi:NYN domain-containing protein [Candidatus Woesearchaeota archaeon]|nr:NYN domain-containing protein [Candidatus Woesearchaeota archaeon]